ncbi:MAG: hypothetical protein J5720_06145 [Bacteroidaceae bacterium]|nr:hypothetical protein [Bacteroidaceae bacterium]
MKYLLILIMMVGTLSLNAQNRPTQTQQKTTTQATASKTFTLTNGKLGPIQVGKKFANIPATYSGLYDKYTRKKETMSDEDGEWTVDYYQFTKGGKNIFRIDLSEDKSIQSITLQEGSAAIVKTPEGFYVGYPARTLFTKKKMEWDNYYMGTVFATDGKYTYHVNSNDVTSEIPTAASQFKSNAKVSQIEYSDYQESDYY